MEKTYEHSPPTRSEKKDRISMKRSKSTGDGTKMDIKGSIDVKSIICIEKTHYVVRLCRFIEWSAIFTDLVGCNFF